ncbi:hypothetical protein [Streptomyces sp. KL116D]
MEIEGSVQVGQQRRGPVLELPAAAAVSARALATMIRTALQ